jgi:hypothetical protein
MVRIAPRITLRRCLLALLVLFLVFVVYDYTSYHARNRRAMAVVKDLGGSAGSLMDWPFGKEIRIAFSRSLADAELERLTVLNSLAGRDFVGVMFNCELSTEQLGSARRALPECVVLQNEDWREVQRDRSHRS